MRSLRRLAVTLLPAAIVAVMLSFSLGSGAPARAAVTTFDAGMSGVWENPAVIGPGSGIAHFTFDDSTRVLTYSMSLSGLSPDQVTAAHIHRGAVGVNGPIIYTLSDKGFTSVSGQITLTTADVTDLMAGNLYVNAHSVANPSGFARGQMYLSPSDVLGDSIKAAAAAYNAKDINRLAVFFTDAGFENEFGTSKADARVHPEAVFQGPITLRSVTQGQITSPTATALFEYAAAGGPTAPPAITLERVSFILDAGLWKLSGSKYESPAIPAGVTTVNVNLQEFAFVYDKSLVSSGNVAFHFANVGKQDHEAVAVKLNTDKSLDQVGADLLQGGPDAPPPPYLDFVYFDQASPGGQFNLVFAQPMPAGRYAFFCFFPDAATGQPHVALGMRSEFTVGSGSTATGTGTGIRPPNTGDAGLLGSTTSTTLLEIGVAFLAFTLLGARVLVRNRA